MTDRADVEIEHSTSPRIAEVTAPSVEFIAQDVVDTLRGNEFGFSGLSNLKLLNASGKEDLGGGVSVGITAALQDTQVAFEGRTTPAETGTVTTGSGAAVANRQTFFDTSATFITNGVQRGSLVINFTDNSIAEVFSVESETELKTKELVNGIGNTYDVADVYHVFNIVQCEMTGGNIVAVDNLGATISPILPTAFTQVVRVSASSATLTSQELLEFSSYQNNIWIDTINGISGTVFPAGTREFPSNNIADAIVIAANVGLTSLEIIGNLTLGVGDDVSNFTISGQNAILTTITIDAAADVTNTEIFNATVTGTLDGNVVVKDCVIGPLNLIAGFFYQCALAATTTITLDGVDVAHFLDCYSGQPGLGTPTIDLNGAGSGLAIRGYNGGITLTNKTGTDAVSLDMSSGQVILDSTVTNGTIVVRGVADLTDNSVGATVVTDGLLNTSTISTGVWEKQVNGVLSGSFGEVAKAVAFNGEVHVDVNNGTAGTAYPLGTRTNPTTNIADALVIAAANNIGQICIAEDVTIAATDDVSGFIIVGTHASKSEITVLPGATTALTQFINCQLLGTMNGQIVVRDSLIEDIVNFEGIAHQCMINPGTITLAGTTDSHILSCYSGVTGVNAPEIDLGGSGRGLGIRDFSGAIKLVNKTGADLVSVDMTSGHIILDGTVTAGSLVIRGNANLTDNSVGATVQTLALLNQDTIPDSVFEEDITTHTTTDSFGKWINSKALTVAKFLGLK